MLCFTQRACICVCLCVYQQQRCRCRKTFLFHIMLAILYQRKNINDAKYNGQSHELFSCELFSCVILSFKSNTNKEIALSKNIILSSAAWQFHMCSVQFSRSVVSDSLRPHELQHARPPCPSPTPGVHSDSRPLSL